LTTQADLPPAPTLATAPRSPIVLRAIMAIGIALSLFQLWAAGVQPLGLFYQRPIHLGFILVLCFLIYPATSPAVRWAGPSTGR